MRLRVHDDYGPVMFWPGSDTRRPCWVTADREGPGLRPVVMWDEDVYGPGWRELVVLDPDADAQRLAEAIGEVWGGVPAPPRPDTAEFAHEVLGQLVHRLAAGTEGER